MCVFVQMSNNFSPPQKYAKIIKNKNSGIKRRVESDAE